MRSPKWPSGILNSQFNGIIVVLPHGSIPPFGAKIYKPSEHKIGSKIFANRSLWVIVSDTTPISTPWFWTCESWVWETWHHISAFDSEHIQPFGELCSSPASYCHLAGIVIESLKDFYSVKPALWDVGKRGKASEFYDHGSVAALYLLWSKFPDQKQCCIEYYDGG